MKTGVRVPVAVGVPVAVKVTVKVAVWVEVGVAVWVTGGFGFCHGKTGFGTKLLQARGRTNKDKAIKVKNVFFTHIPQKNNKTN